MPFRAFLGDFYCESIRMSPFGVRDNLATITQIVIQ